MGVIHKIKPEVKDFVLEQKNREPALSCRALTALVLDNFKIELSKSSVNMIIKEAGLSAPVGRTPKKKRHHIAMPSLPVLLEDTSAKVANTEDPEEEQASREPEEEKCKAEEEVIQKATEEAAQKAEEEAAKKAEAEKWARLAEEERLAKEEETRKVEEERLREEESQKSKEEADKKAEDEAEALRLAALEEEKKRQDEEERKAQEAQLAQEEAKLKSEEELAKKAEAEAAKKAEAEKWARLAEEEEEKRAREESERVISRRQEDPAGAQAFNAERFPEIENTGIILLKAADSIIGASKLIAAAIKKSLPQAQGNPQDLVENLIYLPLLREKAEKSAVDRLSGYSEQIESIKAMNLDIFRIISSSLQEARCVKLILSDGANLYLDGQIYSAWSSPHIPYDFASPVNNLKMYLNKYFNEGSPFVIFNAPGYDMPSPEFFNLLAALDGRGNIITNLVIYGNKLEELEVLPVPQAKKRFFVFGVWPWQFTECRKVKNIGEFRSLRLAEQNKDLYIADLEMELRHPTLGKQMVFNGCAVKAGLNEKTRLVILSNFEPAAKKAEELAAIYFNHWLNPEDAFQDYSRKIELFTYTANSQRYFSVENLSLGLEQVSTVKDLFAGYLAALDAYVRWHLLPGGYEGKEFAVTKERFYNLTAELSKKEESCLISFTLPPEYPFDKDLGYMCRRINEKEIILSNGLKLYITQV